MLKVAYNEFDVTLPVVKRVRYLVRKFRAVVAEDGEDSEATKQESVLESGADTSSVSEEDHVTRDVPAEFERNVFSSDVQSTQTESYELDENALDLSALPFSTKETSTEQRNGFVQELLNSRAFSASASSTEDICELKDVKPQSSVPSSSTDEMNQKRKIKRTKASSDALVKSDNFANIDARASDVPQKNTIDFIRQLLKSDSLFLSDEQQTPDKTLSEVKTTSRRRKTKMAASDEVAQTS